MTDLLHVRKTSFRSDPNVGLYLYATDSYCLAGPEVPEDDYKALSETLGVPVHRFTIAGTGLLGVFLAGTSTQLLVPNIIKDREEKLLEKLGIAYTIIDTDLTALGNNILCNDNGLLLSIEFPPEDVKLIEKALDMKSKTFQLGEITVVGSCAVATNSGCLAHRLIKDFEREMIEGTLKVPVKTGSINLGNPFIKSGLAANKHGFVVGDLSGGPEIVNAEEAISGIER